MKRSYYRSPQYTHNSIQDGSEVSPFLQSKLTLPLGKWITKDTQTGTSLHRNLFKGLRCRESVELGKVTLFLNSPYKKVF